MLIPVLLLLLALSGLALAGRWSIARPLAALVLAGIAVAAGLNALEFGDTVQRLTLLPLPLGQSLAARLDALSTVFVLLVAVISAPVLLFSAAHRVGSLPSTGPLMIGFTVCLLAVPLAGNGLTLLLAWEAMAVCSWLLIVRSSAAGAAAGTLYLGFALLSGVGLLTGIAGPAAWIAIPALLVAGLAKAGIAPLHGWLPPAHAAAPGATSALLSGVMTKVGIYLILRFALMPPEDDGRWSWGWGLGLAGLGAVSAVTALLAALKETDLKRLLARSTLDHLGLMTLLAGLSISFAGLDFPGLAALCLTGCLLHALGHGMMKALAFCATASLTTSAGSRDIRQLGGLMRMAPRGSGLLLLAGSGLCGLPLLAGFAGEWLGIQALLGLPPSAPLALRLAAPLLIGLMALAGALILAVTVRGLGTSLLGQPRSPAALACRELPRGELLPLLILAAGMLSLGLLPGLWLRLIAPASGLLPGTIWLGGLETMSGAGYGPVVLLVLAGLAWMGSRLLFTAPPVTRTLPAWGCGSPPAEGPARPTPEGLAEPLLRPLTPILSRTEIILSRLQEAADRGWQRLLDEADRLQTLNERAALGLILAVLGVMLTGLAVVA